MKLYMKSVTCISACVLTLEEVDGRWWIHQHEHWKITDQEVETAELQYGPFQNWQDASDRAKAILHHRKHMIQDVIVGGEFSNERAGQTAP